MLRSPFYAVLSLVGHLVALAVLFLLLRADFLAAAQVVVYAGAVMVLYVFVVGLRRRPWQGEPTGHTLRGDEPMRAEASGLVGAFGPVFAAAIFVEITIAVVGSSLGGLDGRGPKVDSRFGSPGEIGELLLTKFLLPFEAASFLLLVAAVGAVVLARKRRGLGRGPAKPARSRRQGCRRRLSTVRPEVLHG